MRLDEQTIRELVDEASAVMGRCRNGHLAKRYEDLANAANGVRLAEARQSQPYRWVDDPETAAKARKASPVPGPADPPRPSERREVG